MEDEIERLIDEEDYEGALELLIANEDNFLERDVMLSKKAWLLNRLERHE